MNRKIRAALLAVWFLLALAGSAGAAGAEWTVRFGTQCLAEDLAEAMDGGVFIVGSVGSADGTGGEPSGGTDALAARVDEDGSLRWTVRFGGSGDDAFERVIALADGGCIAMGFTRSTDGHARACRGGKDGFLVRLDRDGGLMWNKCLGGSADDELTDIVCSEEGLIFVCGRTMSRNGDMTSNKGGWDAWTACLDPENGKPVWREGYGTAGDDGFTSIITDYDRILVLGTFADGEAPENGVYPMALCMSLSGEELWLNALGVLNGGTMRVIAPAASGWLLAGEAGLSSLMMPTNRGGMDLWLMNLRTDGSIAWQKSYGGSGMEQCCALASAPGGSLLLLASTSSTGGQVTGNHGGADLWLVCVNTIGTLQWQQTIGGSANSEPVGLTVFPEGEIWVCGNTDAQDGDIGLHSSEDTAFLTRLAVNGNLEETELLCPDEEFSAVRMLHAGEGVYLLGQSGGGVIGNGGSVALLHYAGE